VTVAVTLVCFVYFALVSHHDPPVREKPPKDAPALGMDDEATSQAVQKRDPSTVSSTKSALSFAPTDATPVLPVPTLSPPVVTEKSSPTVAIGLVGGIRTFDYVQHNILDNFVNALQPDRSRRKIFFEVSLANDCLANYVNRKIRDFMDKCNGLFRLYSRDYFQRPEFQANWSNPVMSWSENFDCGHSLVKGTVCCRQNPHAVETIWGFRSYMRRIIMIERIKQYSAESGQKFEWVALIRPDLFFIEPVPHISYFASLSPRMFLCTNHNEAHADYLYILPSSLLLDRLEWSMRDVFERNCGDQGSPEWRINNWWDSPDHLLPRQIFPFSAVIMRYPGWADCFRLQHTTWRNMRPALVAESKRLLTAEENCKRLFPNSRELRDYD
jgi:hypothetical protein